MAKDTLSNAAIILSVIAIIGVAALFLSGRGGVQTITVQASGVAYGFADQATMYIYANGTGQTAALANSNLSATTGAVSNVVMGYLNGNTSLIQTQSYNVFKTKIQSCSGSVCTNRTAYQATQTILVTIPSILNVSNVVASLAAIPSININGVSQKISAAMYARLLNDSLSDAVQNATSQAKALAGSDHYVSIMNITTQSVPIFYGLAASSAAPQNSTYFVGRTGVSRSIIAVFRMNPR